MVDSLQSEPPAPVTQPLKRHESKDGVGRAVHDADRYYVHDGMASCRGKSGSSCAMSNVLLLMLELPRSISQGAGRTFGGSKSLLLHCIFLVATAGSLTGVSTGISKTKWLVEHLIWQPLLYCYISC